MTNSKNKAHHKNESIPNIEDWDNYMSLKKSKLQNQFEKSSKKNGIKKDIFKGTSIFVNGYTKPSAGELVQLMIDYGGIYHHYYTNNKTTFMIASNLPTVKVNHYRNSNVKIIKPEWIIDSIKAGSMIDYKPYLLLSSKFSDNPSISNFQNNKNKSMINKSPPSSNITADLCSEISIDSVNKVNLSHSKLNELNEKSEIVIQGANFTENSIKHHKTASDENFIEEFYKNSRLHHISTMGAIFKQYVNELRLKKNEQYPGRERLKKWITEGNCKLDEKEELDTKNCIMHIDMDCFFVSVGLRSRSDLKGLPVVVTHATRNKVFNKDSTDRKAELSLHEKHFKEKFNSESVKPWFSGIGEFDSMSEIASCSYEARKYGIKNGMLLGQAFKLCPSLKTIQYDFDGYKEVSYSLYNHIASYTLNIEAVSCDEMYVDCTDILSELKINISTFAAILRKEIKELTGCPCSTGFGFNRLVARLATKKAKPDGQFIVSHENIADFIQNVLVSDLPSVGHTITFKLNSMGVKNCKDLQELPLIQLKNEFGNKMGSTLHKYAFGIDERPLNYFHERKSVSAEVNYGIRFKNQSEAEIFFQKLVIEVTNRLNSIGMKGKCITVKLMVKSANAPSETAKFLGHGICDYLTKSASLFEATSNADILLKEVLKIFVSLKVSAVDLRGVGIQISRLVKNKSSSMFAVNLDKFVVKTKKLESSESLNNENFIRDETEENTKKCDAKKIFDESEYDVSFSQMDADYLKALPNSIREEIITNSKKKKKFGNEENMSQNSEIVYNLCIIKENDIPVLNPRLPTPEITKAIAAWVVNEKVPQLCDIKMLSNYLKTLILNGEFESVNFVIEYFQRLSSENDDLKWKNVYQYVTSDVRETLELRKT